MSRLDKQQAWQPYSEELFDSASPYLARLLTEPGSLTQLLREVTQGGIRHRLKQAEWGFAESDEYQKLNIPSSKRVWLRELDWCFNGEPWVFTRTVIPIPSEAENKHPLQETQQPLGELLFAEPSLERTPFEFFKSEHWARRSVFHYRGLSLLIMEIFTPAIFDYFAKNS